MKKTPYTYEALSLPEVYNPNASKSEQELFQNALDEAKDKIFNLEAQIFAVYVREFFQKNPDVESLTFGEGHEYSDEGLSQPIGLTVEFVGYECEDTYYGHYRNSDSGEDVEDYSLAERAQDHINEFTQQFYQFLTEHHESIPTLSAASLEKDIEEMLGSDNYAKWHAVLEKNELEHNISNKKKSTELSMKL
jgi:hypothetical protein